MHTQFTARSETIGTRINRFVTATFSAAIVAMIGLMTTAQYIDTLHI